MGPDAAGQPEEPQWRGLDPALLALRRRECLVLLGVPTLAAAGLLGLQGGGLAGLAALVGGAALLVVALLQVRRRFTARGGGEREHDLLVRRGVLVQRVTVVPDGRMQFGDVTAGPLDRRYDLATVVLHTAAAVTDARIPGLRSAEATRLRDRLAALGEARAAGV